MGIYGGVGMKAGRTYFAALCLGVLLCGCRDVPEGVKENMGRYGENPQKEVSEITYCSIEELREMNVPDIDTGCLLLPPEVDFSGVEEASLLSISCYDDFLTEENVAKYAELFGVSRDGFVEGHDNYFGDREYYDDSESREYVNVMQNGGISHMGGWAYDGASGILEQEYDMAKDDITGVKVRLKDGEADLSELCSSVETWAEENMPVEGVSQRVSGIAVREPEEGERDGDARRVAMCIDYVYKGIPFNSRTAGREESEDGYHSELVTTSICAQLEMDAQEGPPAFFSRNEGFRVVKAEPLEKVVSFESAVRMLSETLSGFGTFRISTVMPLYDLYPDRNSTAPGLRIEARPVYAFLVEEKDDNGFGLINAWKNRYFFFVDMETGEMTTNLEM